MDLNTHAKNLIPLWICVEIAICNNQLDMNIKISKEAYEKQIKEDLYFLNEHCPNSLELDHIKVIIFSSID